MSTHHVQDSSFKETRPEFRFGEGKISGVLSIFLGSLALGAVVVLRFPGIFSTPDARASYPMEAIRLLIDLVLFSALALGLISFILSERKSRGLAGGGLAALALALGGSRVEIEGPIAEGPFLGLDWFLLSIFILALVFVPLERFFARLQDQRVFRKGWRTDLAHFGVSHILVQVTVLATMLPAVVFFRWAVSDALQAWVSSQPLWLQFMEAMFVADLFAYIAHRMFHEIPFLWRFHAIHHSSELLDWLAASRLHVVDIVVTRGFGFIPLYVLGFSDAAIVVYLTWASFQGILNHANLRFGFGPLRYLLVTPQFHHWHHSARKYNRNFAAHLPVIDSDLRDLPSSRSGLAGGVRYPSGYMRQLTYPLARGETEAPSEGGEEGVRPPPASSEGGEETAASCPTVAAISGCLRGPLRWRVDLRGTCAARSRPDDRRFLPPTGSPGSSPAVVDPPLRVGREK